MSLFFIKSVEAMCPVCTIATGVGVGIARTIGIDDTIVGVWIGGLIISAGLWLANFIRKKNWPIPFPEIFSIFLMAFFVIFPLYWPKIIKVNQQVFLGLDKMTGGMIIGVFVFFLAVVLDKLVRVSNNNKGVIYYQKVIIPLLLLSIASLILLLITS